jgi:hypothetical protein
VTEPVDDKTYSQAASRTIGNMFAEIYLGMLEKGMERTDALMVTIEYAKALALRPSDSVYQQHLDDAQGQ